MKKHLSLLLPAIVAITFILPAQSRLAAQDVTPGITQGPQVPLTVGENDIERLKTYAFEDRDEFAEDVRAAASTLDTHIAGLPSNTDLAAAQIGEPPADRALAELTSSRSILEERISKIDLAIPENWELVRKEVVTALSQVRTAYLRAAGR
jgi:hypothetical protein